MENYMKEKLLFISKELAKHEIDIDIQFKNFDNNQRSQTLFGFNSSWSNDGRNSTTMSQNHHIYFDKSELIDLICDYFTTISEIRKSKGLRD